MENTNNIQWKHISVEGAAIVISILLAFAIDAWWDERKDSKFEDEAILGLVDEYEGHVRSLQIAKDLHLRIHRAVASLISACHTGTYQSDEFDIDQATFWLLVPPTTDLGSGVLDTLMSSGQIKLISNKQLRFQLTEWESVLDELKDDEQNGSKIVHEIVAPYLTQHGVPVAYTPSTSEAIVDAPIHVAERKLAMDVVAQKNLLSDSEFLSILELRYTRLAHTTVEFNRVTSAIDSILTALRTSIDR